ncbi:TATA-box-binding protein 2-like [Panonychus citri]|uniref:TATA-box-binding protein 2-like n=1 Tax=Panonychus citri TaxID=50023 RepID=UPI0023078A7A|nr:TATA-box-binding protein 2-like [Panonychus citri]
MRIVNIVVSYEASIKLDPTKYPDYNPKRFSGAIVKYSGGKALVFSSKKFTVTGTTSLKESKKIADDIVGEGKIIKRKILNITGSSTIGFDFDFNKIFYNKRFSWEPELFPGIYWRKSGKGPIVIFFRSKKVIITGVKKIKDLDALYKDFLDDLK